MLKNNSHYFEVSSQNPEIKLDSNYMFLERNKEIEEYVKSTRIIKSLLTKIKDLSKENKDDDHLYEELYKLSQNKFGQKTEFNCFINTCDTTIKTLREDDDLENFKNIVLLYLENRTISSSPHKGWIQAIIDKGASRSIGRKGETKIIQIAKKNGFKEVDSWDDFKKENRVIVKFTKNRFDVNSIKSQLDIDLQFNSQNKMLDIIIKSGDKIIFIEAKHLKEAGGSQDKQVGELINIIRSKNNENENVLYGAFLDGVYSNSILGDSDSSCHRNNKISRQQKEIRKALKNNKNNFWFNTKGFEEFIKDF